MRLIDTETFELREYTGSEEIPKYAILSHTWGDGDAEFSREQFHLGRRNDKVERFCAQAPSGQPEVWMD